MNTVIEPYYDPVVPSDSVPLAPKSVDVSITGKCNLKCAYCFYADEMQGLSDLPFDRWDSFFQECEDLGVQRATLSGGEAFCRPDLFRVIDAVIDHKMRYSLLSNGTLITKKTIKSFEEGKRRLRLDSIQVSIDGSTAFIHNKSRPPDSFDAAIRGLRLLINHEFPVTVRVTINAHNVYDLDNIASFLLEDIGINSFGTNEADYFGSARCGGQRVLLSEKERQYAMDTLLRLQKEYHGRINAMAGPLSRAHMFADIKKAVDQGKTGFSGRGTLCSCGGVFQKISVLHDGTMVPCNMLPKLTMGVIGINPVSEVWLHHPSINAVRHRRKIPLTALSTCADCPYTGFCTGGCPATVMSKTGRLLALDPLTCYRLYIGEDTNEQHIEGYAEAVQ